VFCSRLELGQSSRLLEVASGSGGPALFTAATTGCRIIGVDIHQAGIAEGNKVARERGLAERVCFVCPNARERLSFEDGGFSAVICSTRSTICTSEQRSWVSGIGSCTLAAGFCSPTRSPSLGFCGARR